MFLRRIFLTLTVTAAVLVGVVFLAVRAQAVAPGEVVINELFWMGSSKVSADEWIELRNLTDQPISLDNWVVYKKSSGQTVAMLTIPAGKVIPAKGFFLIANYAETDPNSQLAVTPDVVATAVSLVNSDLQVTLADANGVTIDVADDGAGTPFAGKYVSGSAWHSMERDFVPADGALKEHWHSATARLNLDEGLELGTPKAANSNLPPEIKGLSDRTATVGEAIPFDASESSDPEGDPLTFSWTFGDGSSGTGPTPTQTYASAGTYRVSLVIADGQTAAKAEAEVTIGAAASAPPLPTVPAKPSQPAAPVSSTQPSPAAPGIVPQPTPTVASDRPARLPSPTAAEQPIGQLVMTEVFPDPVGQDRGQEFVELKNVGTETAPLLGWKLSDSKRTVVLPDLAVAPDRFLVLRGAELKLPLRNAGATIFLIDPNGRIRSGVRIPKAKTGQSFSRLARRWAWSVPTPAALNRPPAGAALEQPDPNEGVESLSIDEARQAEAGTKLKLSGTVVVALGTIGERQLLLGDATGTIVLTLDRRLNLRSGDQMAAVGRKSTAQEPRLKVKVKDLKHHGTGNPIEPAAVAVGDLSEDDLGGYIRVTGTVSQRRGRQFTLEDETGQLSVTDPNAGVKKGDQLTVTGIVRATSGRLRLVATATEVVTSSQTQVLSAHDTAEPPAAKVLAGQSSKTPTLGYVLLTLAGLLLFGRQLLLPRLRTTPSASQLFAQTISTKEKALR